MVAEEAGARHLAPPPPGLRYDPRMQPITSLSLKSSAWGQALRRALFSWWYLLQLGAIALVMAFSPSTYQGRHRGLALRQIHTSTWQVLPWFATLAALISLVLIRIVVVTAVSYGLSQYALEMMVRVLVLELIPLSAALFVALRAGLTFHAGRPPAAAPGAEEARAHGFDLEQVRGELVPQVVANVFSVLTLALVSSVIVLVFAYLNVYGLSPWGLVNYTRTVGRVFDPLVTLGFVLKTVFFGLAVAVIPAAAMLEARRRNRGQAFSMQPGTVRLLLALFLIEAASLMVKYI